MDFKQSLVNAAKHGPAQQAEVITLNEYIDRVSERPTVAATAHERIYDMIRAAGFSDGHHAGEVSHGFFREELFGLDMPLDQYLAVGEKALAATREQFIATARKINPKASPLAVYLSITRIHPAPDALLATAQRDLGLLRAFVEAKQLITRRPMRTSRWSRRPPSSGRRPALPRTLRVRSRPSPPRPTTT